MIERGHRRLEELTTHSLVNMLGMWRVVEKHRRYAPDLATERTLRLAGADKIGLLTCIRAENLSIDTLMRVSGRIDPYPTIIADSRRSNVVPSFTMQLKIVSVRQPRWPSTC